MDEVCPRILVVEDDADQRQLLVDVLSSHYGRSAAENIVAVGSAAEALGLDLGKFQAVLQDYNLPDIPGSQLLRGILERADLPVIVITSQNDAATAAEMIRGGAQDYVVKLGDYLFTIPVLLDKNIRQHQLRQENQRLQGQLQQMLQELRSKNSQLEQSLEQLKVMATTDHLTGLSNRRQFNELLDRSFNEAMRYGFDLTCCMCDLDHYKRLNDTFGHQTGDRLLVAAADVIRANLRASDVAARYGGDEFVLLLPHASIDQALVVAERIRQQLAFETLKHFHLSPPVSLSVGIASLVVHRPASCEVLVSLADKALYQAKQQGKDQIIVYGASPALAR